MKKMIALRSSLIDYTKNLESSNKLLADINDYQDFIDTIAMQDESITRIASMTTAIDVSNPEIKEVKTSILGDEVEQSLKDMADKELSNLIATNIGSGFSGGGNDVSDISSPTPKGFYVVIDGMNENVLTYTEELDRNVNSVFSDVDGDEDFDMILSMGGDVYLKTNYKNTPSRRVGKVRIDTLSNNVSDFVLPGGSGVDNVASPFESNERADISWIKKDGAIAYEVILKQNLNELKSEARYRYIALPNPLESSESQTILGELGVLAESENVIELTNSEAPSVSLTIENGNYFAEVYSYNAVGEISMVSNSAIVSPQICADEDAPFPALGTDQFEVSIFKSLIIDAGNSFDPSGEVTDFFLELLPYVSDKPYTAIPVDEDGNLQPHDKSSPVFNVGPFVNEGDIGDRLAILHVLDQTGNSSAQSVSIKVFAPEISLNETFNRTGVAVGSTSPGVDSIPFSVFRTRYIERVVDGALKLVERTDKVLTASADQDGKYYTDSAGDYEINDFDLKDMILVENADGEIVAVIDPETGNVGEVADGYHVEVDEAVPPFKPTTVRIVSDSGELMATIAMVADANTDVSVFDNVRFDYSNIGDLSGVNVRDNGLSDAFIIVGIAA